MSKFFLSKNKACCKCETKIINKKMEDITEKFSLANLQINEIGQIIGYDKNINFAQKKRLLELGFINQNKVKLVKKSMLGEVLLFEVNGYMLGVGKSLAKYFLCKRIYDK